MSSACVCHTDEWCFYCNMYSPLEKEHSRLKGEIQRLIDELELEERRSKHIGSDRGYSQARGIAFSIYKLKELIPSEACNTRNAPKP
jgi:hypothetical protein